jgi:hypothetical protein
MENYAMFVLLHTILWLFKKYIYYSGLNLEVCKHNILAAFSYLLPYLLHAAESFLRS